MVAYAHSRNQQGNRHDLVDHLVGTARLTADFAEALGAHDLGYYLGLWHDIGKFDPEWQRYLLDAEAGRAAPGTGPDHKAAGTSLARASVGLLSGLVVHGHHGGLRERVEVDGWLGVHERKPEVVAALQAARSELSDLEPTGPIPLPEHLEVRDRGRDRQAMRRSSELFFRLIFSALVDADSLDTEAHVSASRAALRGSEVTLAALWGRFEAAQQVRLSSATPVVQQARDTILDACIRAAELPAGLFRLTAPTGGGKTLSAMAFALRHALKHQQRRVIVAVPFISITEQTARVYRDVFGGGDADAPVVLEHHSGSRELTQTTEESSDGDFRPGAAWSQLVAENWDAPIVVTTTVQLFESLFARKRTACRKLHRLAKSVIILDEAQALPVHLLEPILDVLQELCAYYGTTVLFSTATQPAFEAIPAFKALPARDILDQSQIARLFADLKRVTYEWPIDQAMTWDEVAALLQDGPQALAILNTKANALALIAALEAAGMTDVLHLSTLLCGAHRRDVLAKVTRRLSQGEPCRLISTQVVEAGVDLDFPLVLRALGPLDGIVQAAGRCNREGTLGVGAGAGGRVIVFRPADGGIPRGTYERGRAITAAMRTTEAHQDRELDPNDPALFQAYSRLLLSLEVTDSPDVQRPRADFDYPTVSTRFRMIDDDTMGLVITSYGTDKQQREVRALLDGLRDSRQATIPPARPCGGFNHSS